MTDIIGVGAIVIATLLVSFLIFGLLFMYLSMLRVAILELMPQEFSDYVYRFLLIRQLKERYRKELRNCCSFYRQLSPKNKKSFEKRVQRFIDSKEFISRGPRKTKVSDRQLVQISATAIQLTYGHPQIYLSHFTKILIYPDSYYSTITKKRHQGEVNARGFIVLSWTNFQKGFSRPDDGFNLGFHEMAHALQLENLIENGEFDFLDKSALNRLHLEQQSLRSDENQTLFRARSFENKFEFFAVAVENFFERPKQLLKANKEVYELMCLILRQNPILLSEASLNRTF